MQDIWPRLRRWVEESRDFALATVTRVAGSSPRGVGATLAIARDGAFLGSVSAGCVENAVIETAERVLEDGRTRWMEFDVSRDYPWEVALTCGGKIRVRIDPSPFESGDEELEKTLAEQLDGARPFALATSDGSVALRTDGAPWSGPLAERAAELCPTELDTATEVEGVLFRRFEAPPTLYVIGATHIATHLVRIAKELGFRTVVLDPREAYARAERFAAPPDELVCDWPHSVLRPDALAPRDAAVLVTHDAKIDDAALQVLLESPIGYVGALGSRRSHAARLRRLEEAGVPADRLERIHGPVGLDIGSETPAEIAVSIAAEIIRSRSEKPAPAGNASKSEAPGSEASGSDP